MLGKHLGVYFLGRVCVGSGCERGGLTKRQGFEAPLQASLSLARPIAINAAKTPPPLCCVCVCGRVGCAEARRRLVEAGFTILASGRRSFQLQPATFPGIARGFFLCGARNNSAERLNSPRFCLVVCSFVCSFPVPETRDVRERDLLPRLTSPGGPFRQVFGRASRRRSLNTVLLTFMRARWSSNALRSS